MPKLAIMLFIWSALTLAEPVKLVTGPDYAPYTDPSLPEGGLAAALVKKVMKQARLPYELEWRPWSNGYSSTLKGAYTGTFPYMSTPERRKLFNYSDPLFVLEIRVFALEGSHLDGTKLETLAGKRYCHPLGWAYLKQIEIMIKKGLLHPIRPYDMSACIRLLAEDKADFIITDQKQGKESIANLAKKLPQIPVPVGGIIETITLHLITPINHPKAREFLMQFNQALQEVHQQQ
ncbi:polar amino acid transport system substrate-binding protein [Iodobacter fluviatilis]|uniref:Bacterial extracellular solute-binding proteins, family 3 n=2 Tax=Iodobacter fluviatilis TaxID=537 RepID=A0A377SVT7_9NEIS|nr:polar amino acid transport system substrate-binding protein [Iodobacter fluviatilis]STR45448.1 Bacterial extracellular solute-binding proteins, family 3 [Iodobacter fluviatilis]